MPEPQSVPESDEEALKRFLEIPISSSDGVFEIFRKLPGAGEAHGAEKQGYLYVPGTRPDRCVLAAHADTVFDRVYRDRKFTNTPVLENGVYHGTNPDASIGADDRSGCAMLWLLRNSGHSLLILDGEEAHQRGAFFLKENDPELFAEINSHTFIIELDRRGFAEFRTYLIPVTKAFVSFIKKETGFYSVPGQGRTDIVVLCEEICGVNLSVGYEREHHPDETLNVSDWKNTLNVVRKMTGKPLKRYKTKRRSGGKIKGDL